MSNLPAMNVRLRVAISCDDVPLDAVEIRPARLPVIRVSRRPDHLVRLELDEFERARADRMGAHLARRHMAGIDRRPAGGEQRKQCRLRPLQVEGDLVITIGRHPVEVEIPSLARIDAELFAADAHQQIPGAFDVGGGKGLAVVPFDALAQREGQLLAVLAPGPARRQIGDDRVRAVLRHMLIEHDEVVEHAHHRPQCRTGRFLEQRHARRIVEKRDLQDAPGLLGQGRVSAARRDQQPAHSREGA